MSWLSPCEVARSIFEVDYDRLYNLGKRAIIFDLDNTLGKRRPDKLSPKVTALFERLAQKGFLIGILTNRRIGTKDPVIVELANKYPLRCRAGKPRQKGFRQLLVELDVSPENAVMIGDRVFTDILGANRLGIYSIRIKR